MRRRGVAALLALSLLTISSGSGQESARTKGALRPNILWIIAEDLGPDLGCDGAPEVRTPHLDRLAREGVRFTRAFATAPVCSTSRSAFMTGVYQTRIHAHHHRSHRDGGNPLPDDVMLLSHRLRGAGYATANLVWLTEDPDERFFRGTGKTDWNFSFEGRAFDTDRWSEVRQREPFYAQVNFPETHRGNAWDHAHERIDTPADPAKVEFPPYYPDHPVVRQDWAQYLDTVMALDRKVGFVRDLLEEGGLDQRTVVFFFSDHGRAMVRAKQWPYDSGLRVPLLVYWPPGREAPDGYAAGTASAQLVSLLDVTATTLALAGAPRDGSLDGRVLFGPDRAPPREYVFGARDRCDETVDFIRTVRDARYRYLRNGYPERPFLQTNRYKEFSYPVIHLMRWLREQGRLTDVQARLLAPTRPPEELYDLQADPYEIHNLAGSPDHQEDLRRLRTALDAWMADTKDPGATPEDPAVVQHYLELMQERYDTRIAERKARLLEEWEQR